MNFNDALDKARDLAQARLADLQEDVYIVRDLQGRIRLLLKKRRPAGSQFRPHIDALVADITAALDHYAYDPGDMIMVREELKTVPLPDAATATVLAEAAGFKVYLHDRLLIGGEWSARAAPESTSPKRFTLYSMKGGVGRSTTTAVLAWHLARKGKRVLVLDMDLESPGVGKTLLGTNMPRYGLVDWFVENALGQGDAVLGDLVVASPLGDGTGGWIGVAPAFGNDERDYLAKLGRAYLERGASGPEPWPKRLERLVKALEQQETPDVVLLDSRTGLHDASAALVLAMGASTLLFAVDTAQTWSAYRFLFEHWRSHPSRREFQDMLWLVGAMVPDTDTQPYFDRLCDSSWALFEDTLYEPAGTVAEPDRFTFPQNAEAGNHYPRPIYWQRALVAFDPLANWTDQFVEAAYKGFLDWFDATLLAEGGGP